MNISWKTALTLGIAGVVVYLVFFRKNGNVPGIVAPVAAGAGNVPGFGSPTRTIDITPSPAPAVAVGEPSPSTAASGAAKSGASGGGNVTKFGRRTKL